MQDLWQIKQLSRDDLTLRLLPGIGGRLWDIVYKGRPLLFKNTDLLGLAPDTAALTDLPTKSPQFGFPLWGGEKTWVAPDVSWIDGAPYPVLDSGPYEEVSCDAEHITMRSAVCPLSQIQIERQIRIGVHCTFSIHHKISNHSKESRFAGIWSVLMTNRPAGIGLVTENSEFTPVLGEPTGHIEHRHDTLICKCAAQKEFKIGAGNSTGRVFLCLGDMGDAIWLLCSTPEPSETDEFAHSHPFEIFNSGDYPYCEAEWHAPAKLLHPGEADSFIQEFTVWSGNRLPGSLKTSTSERELMKCMS